MIRDARRRERRTARAQGGATWGEVDRAIVVCGSGAGACIAADKVRGARAAYAGDTYTAHQAVEHDGNGVSRFEALEVV